eukprot:TRINITY_DN4079_c0_g1_i1.p1 TRINITY_DN4079_c0_g1~~TRINITY_DN4079_c0_g1_i1.p1  ORF type:complete len:95 (+),score=17.84 TRINITY_DN4079_c0_g1_i1:122-406(+)
MNSQARNNRGYPYGYPENKKQKKKKKKQATKQPKEATKSRPPKKKPEPLFKFKSKESLRNMSKKDLLNYYKRCRKSKYAKESGIRMLDDKASHG